MELIYFLFLLFFFLFFLCINCKYNYSLFCYNRLLVDEYANEDALKHFIRRL